MLEHKRVKKGCSEDLCHPTWEDRAVYIMRDFNEALVRKVAADTGCKNEREILYQIKYYKKVFENDGFMAKRAVFKIVCFSLELLLLATVFIILYIKCCLPF